MASAAATAAAAAAAASSVLDDPDWFIPQLTAASTAFRWAVANAPSGTGDADAVAFVNNANTALDRLALLTSRVEFARADKRLAEGEVRVAAGDFAGAAALAASVGGAVAGRPQVDPRLALLAFNA